MEITLIKLFLFLISYISPNKKNDCIKTKKEKLKKKKKKVN